MLLVLIVLMIMLLVIIVLMIMLLVIVMRCLTFTCESTNKNSF